MWHVDKIIKAVHGTPYRIEQENFSGISTDSRTIREGELFVPLKGLNFDGHLYMDASYERSRAGSLCDRGRPDLAALTKGTVILVDDTLPALLNLASYRRRETPGRVIALTGSNGKTTTKELMAQMLGRAFSVHYNERNYNNLVGVSMSVLTQEGTPELSIYELGTNNKGEIAKLAEVTKPDIALITNVNASHLEGLGSIEGVLEEKLALFHGTRDGGTLLVNADDPSIVKYRPEKDHRLFTYSAAGKEADFRLSIDEDLGWGGFHISLLFPGETVEVRTRLLGRHNLSNILAAASAAHAAGLPGSHIAGGIEEFGPYSMRFTPVRSKDGYIVVDDSYNANPSSTRWALATLLELPCRGRRIAILGDMRELGEETTRYHRELGRFLKESRIHRVLLFGEYVRETYEEAGSNKAFLFESKEALIEHVKATAEEGDVILVKGSRAARMDEIVEALI